jgi:hypothetical protein
MENDALAIFRKEGLIFNSSKLFAVLNYYGFQK